MAKLLSLCVLVLVACAVHVQSVDVAITVIGSGSSGCYRYNGGGCNTAVTWVKGSTYVLSLSATGHPLRVLVDSTGTTSYSGSLPVADTGLTSGTFTVTIPANETATALRLYCQTHRWSIPVTLIASTYDVLNNAGGDCYLLNGATAPCQATAVFSLVAGYTYVLNVEVAGHPLVVLTASDRVAANLFSGATPNPLAGVESATITLTIPLTTTVTNLYFYCRLHDFALAVAITGAQVAPSSTATVTVSSTASSSTSTGVSSTGSSTVVSSTGTGSDIGAGYRLSATAQVAVAVVASLAALLL